MFALTVLSLAAGLLAAASLLDTLVAAAVVLAALALGAVAASLYSRRGPVDDGFDSLDGDSVSAQLQAIGSKIDRTIVQQRHQGETDRRVLAQKVDGLSETVDTQGNELAGLRNELRHEVRRRDAEIDELRLQLTKLRTGDVLPASALAALPPAESIDGPARPVGEPPAAPPAADAAPADAPADASLDAFSAEPEALPSADVEIPEPVRADPVPVEADPFDIDYEAEAAEPGESADVAAEIEDLDALAFEPPAPPAAPPEAPAAVEPDAGEPVGDGEAGDGAPPAPSIFTPISFGAPATPPAEASVWVARPPEAQGEAVAADPEDVVQAAFPAPDEDAPDGAATPEGAEDLTVISSIDESTQAFLYSAGVLTLDDVARIGRSDAQRLGHEVGVSEHTIMNQWVFEAQAALFNRFSKQARS